MSLFSLTFSFSIGLLKLGQPVPESYLSSELNRGSPDTTSTYMPGFLLSQYSLLNGLSVPSFCVTLYCSGASIFLSSSSDGFSYFLGSFILRSIVSPSILVFHTLLRN